jgi:hypothetical protein
MIGENRLFLDYIQLKSDFLWREDIANYLGGKNPIMTTIKDFFITKRFMSILFSVGSKRFK